MQIVESLEIESRVSKLEAAHKDSSPSGCDEEASSAYQQELLELLDRTSDGENGGRFNEFSDLLDDEADDAGTEADGRQLISLLRKRAALEIDEPGAAHPEAEAETQQVKKLAAPLMRAKALELMSELVGEVVRLERSTSPIDRVDRPHLKLVSSADQEAEASEWREADPIVLQQQAAE